jgi:1,4-alpha-glucan branching enzyme
VISEVAMKILILVLLTLNLFAQSDIELRNAQKSIQVICQNHGHCNHIIDGINSENIDTASATSLVRSIDRYLVQTAQQLKISSPFITMELGDILELDSFVTMKWNVLMDAILAKKRIENTAAGNELEDFYAKLKLLAEHQGHNTQASIINSNDKKAHFSFTQELETGQARI